jgi:predicted nucleotidyltransferase
MALTDFSPDCVVVTLEDSPMRPSERLREHMSEVLALLARYPMISNVRLVGSVARGEDTEDSDIDLLVDTADETTLFDIGGLHEDLVDLLETPVDIISSGGRMHEYMRMTIERDARPL